MKFNIYSDGEKINTIVADEAFCKKYCEKNGYTYELVDEATNVPSQPEPTAEDMLNALAGGMSYE